MLLPLAAAGSQTLRGHVPRAASAMNAAGLLSATNRLHLVIGLPLRNTEGLSNFLQRLYDPASPDYHRYLAPEQFTEQFGPSQADYNALVVFASASGLKVAATHPGRTLLDVEAPVAAVEKAFHLTIRQYRHPSENRTFFAPDSEPTLDLNVPVLHVTGLDNYFLPHPNAMPIPLGASESPKPNAGSGPSGAYQGYDFRNAYALGVPLTGSGQVIGLLELGGYDTNDIVKYENITGLPNVALQNVLLGGASGLSGPDDSEACLDIEMAVAMAPGVSSVVVYEAPMTVAGWLDVLGEMANPTHGEPRPAQLQQFVGAGRQPQRRCSLQKICRAGSILFPSLRRQRRLLLGQLANGRHSRMGGQPVCDDCRRDQIDNRCHGGPPIRNDLEFRLQFRGATGHGQRRRHRPELHDSNLAGGHQHDGQRRIENEAQRARCLDGRLRC
ncbi:MAG TPA: protease pro-enzyme activation domain-containing protein [Verrucomicrobiae bacterium]|jgi:hypothetical protein